MRTARALHIGDLPDLPDPGRSDRARLPRLGAGLAATVAVLGLAAAGSHHPPGTTSAPVVEAAAAAPSPAPDPAAADVYAQAAATCPGLAPTVLEAVHEVESSRSADDRTSSAGARGPMQFLPDTWQAYGIDADGDGRAEVDDPVDAIFSAARLLCANGAGEARSLRSALWNYNHSWAYVDLVLTRAGELDAPG